MRVVPIKESHTLDLTWDIPPTEPLYTKAPTNYLSHLLGHEGAGSAFALLKARGLATALSAGTCGCCCGSDSQSVSQAVMVPVVCCTGWSRGQWTAQCWWLPAGFSAPAV